MKDATCSLTHPTLRAWLVSEFWRILHALSLNSLQGISLPEKSNNGRCFDVCISKVIYWRVNCVIFCWI